LGSSLYAATTTSLPAGTYKAMLSPAVEEPTANKIEKELTKIKGLGSVDVTTADSSVRFTVKPEGQIDVAKLQSAIYKVSRVHTISEPVMEGTDAAPLQGSDQAPGMKAQQGQGNQAPAAAAPASSTY